MKFEKLVEKLKEAASFFCKVKYSKKVNSNDNILIYGISRGGTTLLAEALVKTLDARLIWEPLFPYRKVILEKINPYSTHRYSKLQMGWYPHVANNDVLEVNSYFDELFSLKERNIRFYRFTNYDRFSSQKATVIKFCFANFMYPYFNQRYGFKAIILLRHPFAIAASSLQFGDNYKWIKENYSIWKYSSNKWSNNFGDRFKDNLHLISSAFTVLVFQTVTQFNYILEHRNHLNSIVLFYEDLVTKPDMLFSDLRTFFGEGFNLDMFVQSLGKQSFSSKKGHTEQNPLLQLSKWKQICSKDDIDKGLEIFKALSFNEYDEDILPIKNR